MKRLEAELEAFTKEVIPKDCPEVQFIEMRRSFMGGASSMLAIMGELTTLGPGQAFDEIDKLMIEMAEFLEKVQRGEA